MWTSFYREINQAKGQQPLGSGRCISTLAYFFFMHYSKKFSLQMALVTELCLGFVKAMKELEIHQRLIEEMGTDDTMSEGEGDDNPDEVGQLFLNNGMYTLH